MKCVDQLNEETFDIRLERKRKERLSSVVVELSALWLSRCINTMAKIEKFGTDAAWLIKEITPDKSGKNTIKR